LEGVVKVVKNFNSWFVKMESDSQSGEGFYVVVSKLEVGVKMANNVEWWWVKIESSAKGW
jgi:hypothetical protein